MQGNNGVAVMSGQYLGGFPQRPGMEMAGGMRPMAMQGMQGPRYAPTGQEMNCINPGGRPPMPGMGEWNLIAKTNWGIVK